MDNDTVAALFFFGLAFAPLLLAAVLKIASGDDSYNDNDPWG